MLLIRRYTCVRVAWLALLVAANLLFCTPGTVAAKDEKACGGSDMLAELQHSDQEAFAQVMAEARGTANDGALLWRISRQGIPDSYLFGTVHLTDERVTTLSSGVREAIAGARVVALEVADVSPGALAAAIAKSPQLMMLENGQRLDHLISPEAFAEVKKQLETARLPSALAHQVKPWVVSMVMAVSECERKRMANGKPVVDMRVAETARAEGIPVVGLESVQSQLEAAASVPMAEQVALLKSSLEMANRVDDLRETLLQLYLSRRIGAVLPLQGLFARRSGIRQATFDGFKSKMIEQRNRLMRTHALPLLAEGNVFIAVGALHLIGENGLVELLRNAGYTLEAIE